MKYKIFSIAFFFSSFLNLYSVNYYFANNGEKYNSGLTPASPWRYLDHLKSIDLAPGDTIFLKSGETFRGTIKIKTSGTPQFPIVICTYEGKERAILSGAEEINWVGHKNGIYHGLTNEKISFLFLNNIYQQEARYPNTHPLITDNDSKYLGFMEDNSIGEKEDGFFTGSVLYYRPLNWQYERRKVFLHEGNTIEYDSAKIKYQQGVYKSRKGFDYFFVGKREFLDFPGEWVQEGQELKYFPLNNFSPANSLTEGVTRDYGIFIGKGTKNIHVQNIHLDKFAITGIYCADSVQSIIIKNNLITNIGEMGIECWYQAKSCSIINNQFYNIYGRGISITEGEDNLISENQLKKIGMLPGYGFSGVNNASGIVLQNREVFSHGLSMNNQIIRNVVDSTGYNGIRMDGAFNLMKNNLVKNYMLLLNDGGGIYCWGGPFKYTFSNIIEGNIVIQENSNYSHRVSSGNGYLKKAIYLDAGTHGVKVKNNIIINGYMGILTNFCTHENEISGNVLYGIEKYGITANYSRSRCDLDHNNHFVKNNTIIGTDTSFTFVRVAKMQDTVTTFYSKFDNNVYVNSLSKEFASDQNFIENILDKTIYLTYDEWQNRYNYDSNSNYINLSPMRIEFPKVIILVNPGNKIKSLVTEPGIFAELTGKEIPEEITIKPFNCKVFLCNDDIEIKMSEKINNLGIIYETR